MQKFRHFIIISTLLPFAIAGCNRDHSNDRRVEEKKRQIELSRQKSKQLEEAVEREKNERAERKKEELAALKIIQEKDAKKQEERYWEQARFKWDTKEQIRQNRLGSVLAIIQLARIKGVLYGTSADYEENRVEGQMNRSLMIWHNALHKLYLEGEITKEYYEKEMLRVAEEYEAETRRYEKMAERWEKKCQEITSSGMY